MKVELQATVCALLISVICFGCTKKISQKNESEQPRVGAGRSDTGIILCWFVENDGTGKHGYAAVDGRAGDPPPEGGGLFTSINDLKKLIDSQYAHCTIDPQFPAEPPEGWRIRKLTGDEILFLYSRTKSRQ